jgi:hypothetical protein
MARGRKRKADARTALLNIRLTDAEKRVVERLAADEGLRGSTWARVAILRAASLLPARPTGQPAVAAGEVRPRPLPAAADVESAPAPADETGLGPPASQESAGERGHLRAPSDPGYDRGQDPRRNPPAATPNPARIRQ